METLGGGGGGVRLGKLGGVVGKIGPENLSPGTPLEYCRISLILERFTVISLYLLWINKSIMLKVMLESLQELQERKQHLSYGFVDF